MSKRLIVRLTAGVVCVVITLAAAIVWVDLSRRAEPLRPGTYAGEQWIGNSLNIPFRWCPAGTFTMGSPATELERREDEDQVSVTLTQGFWLGQTEVTQGQWQSVMGTAPWLEEDEVHDGELYPAVCMSHGGGPDSAVAFCEKLTARERAAGRLPLGWLYRLPTEAEWEYACRAGTTSTYFFRNDATKLGQYAWFYDNCKDRLSGTESWLGDHTLYARPVGTKPENPWGLRDMHGSVWEWCAGGYDAKPPGGVDPQGHPTGSARVNRGGSWSVLAVNCRSATRHWYAHQKISSDDLGFRITLSQSPR